MLKKLIAAAIILLGGSAAFAQTSPQSAVFLDNYMYGYRSNAAFQSEKSFFGFLVNDIGMSASSNVGLSNFIFRDATGAAVIALNNKVPAEQFLSKLPQIAVLSEDVNYSLFSFGMRKDESFFTLEASLRQDMYGSLSKDFFAFLKDTRLKPVYDLKETGLNTTSYFEIAAGYSRTFAEKFTVGARLKFLLGYAHSNIRFTQADVAAADGIKLDADGQMLVACNMLEMGTHVSDLSGKNVLDFTTPPVFVKKFSPAGYGFAADLGVSYKAMDNLDIYLGVNDLGGISWHYNTVGHVKGHYENESAETSFDSVTDQLEEEIKKLQGFSDFERQAPIKAFEGLSCSLNAGVKYRMPFYRRWSAGLNGYYKIGGPASWGEARLGTTVTPLDWLSLSANIGYGTFGTTGGAALSINALGINFFLSADSYLGGLGAYTMPQEEGASAPAMQVILPYNKFRFNVQTGLTITIGDRHSPFAI